MKPLLIAVNAKYIHTNNAVRLLKANSAFQVEYMEFTIKDSLEYITETILHATPTLLGFSTYIWNVEMIKAIVLELRKSLDIPIILGGPEVSYDAEHFLRHWPIDGVVKGEGERVFDSIIAYYHNLKPLDINHNFASYNNDYPIREIEDLSSLKSPHFEVSDLPAFPHRIHYLESSRGCPYQCSYCLSSLEKKVRFFPLDSVLNNLNYLIKHGATTIKFLDRTFNANRSMLAIIDAIIKNHRKGQSYQFEITADRLDETIIDYIHKHSPKKLFRFEVGIQSTHSLTNQLVDRHQNHQILFNTLQKIIDGDIIDLHLDLIAGLPKENLARFKETFNTVYQLGAKELQLGFLKMLRGTKIRLQAARFGYQFQQTAPYEITQHDDLSHADLTVIREVEQVLNVFHNKNLFNRLVYHHATRENAFDFFYQLSQHLKTRNVNLHRYQLDELYRHYEAFLTTKNLPIKSIDELRFLYLKRAKIKPKCYFPIVENKTQKHACFEVIKDRHQLSINQLFKHSIVAYLFNQYHVFYYHDLTCKCYPIETVQ